MSRFGLHTKIVARAGQRDALVGLLLDAATALQPVADCELYIVHTAPTEPNTIWVTEIWRSREAHQAFLATDAFKAARGRGRSLIEQVGEQIEVVPVGGKGLPASQVMP